MTITIPTERVPLTEDEFGVLRVGKTRVTLDLVIAAYLQHFTAEEIVDQYDALDLADVYNVIAFYLRHQDEIDAYLDKRREEAEEVRREIEARWPADGIRERLLARRAAPNYA